uniref:Zinc finger AN1-type containing 3 n=1 Tax=Apteryx owenii TaxID=8824 RepID=A0A8B9S9J2_APTOW
MNLCSKCFAEKRNPHNEKDFQKKQPEDDSTPSTSNSQSDLFSGETNSDNSNTSLTTQAANPNQQLLTELNVTSPSKEECGPCTGTAHASLTTPTKRSCDSDSQSESEASPVKRPRLLDDSNDRPEETSRSKQKSRRRCFQCQTKLELVQQELGSCRCVFQLSGVSQAHVTALPGPGTEKPVSCTEACSSLFSKEKILPGKRLLQSGSNVLFLLCVLYVTSPA